MGVFLEGEGAVTSLDTGSEPVEGRFSLLLSNIKFYEEKHYFEQETVLITMNTSQVNFVKTAKKRSRRKCFNLQGNLRELKILCSYMLFT